MRSANLLFLRTHARVAVWYREGKQDKARMNGAGALDMDGEALLELIKPANLVCITYIMRRVSKTQRICLELSASAILEQVLGWPLVLWLIRRIWVAEYAKCVALAGGASLTDVWARDHRSKRLICGSGQTSRRHTMSMQSSRLPEIPFGPYSVSRLIAGGNPPHGGSHQTKLMDMHMREYFTLDQTVEFLRRCAKQGINTWQMTYGQQPRDALIRFREEGGKMQFICLCPPDKVADKDEFAKVLELDPIGVAFHGEVTDRYLARRDDRYCA